MIALFLPLTSKLMQDSTKKGSGCVTVDSAFAPIPDNLGSRSVSLNIQLKNGPSATSFTFIFGLFQINIKIFLQQINVKNVHPIYDARNRTHDLQNMSLLPLVTTRPGLLLLVFIIWRKHENKEKEAGNGLDACNDSAVLTGEMSFADVSCAKLSSKLQNLITKEGRLFLSLMIDCGSIKIMRTHYRFRPPDGGESPIHDVQDDEVQGCQMVCSQCTSKILYFYAKMVLKSLRIMQARTRLNFTVGRISMFISCCNYNRYGNNVNFFQMLPLSWATASSTRPCNPDPRSPLNAAPGGALHLRSAGPYTAFLSQKVTGKYQSYFFKWQTQPLFRLFLVLSNKQYHYLQQIDVKKCQVHPEYGAGIRTHDLSNMNRLP